MKCELHPTVITRHKREKHLQNSLWTFCQSYTTKRKLDYLRMQSELKWNQSIIYVCNVRSHRWQTFSTWTLVQKRKKMLKKLKCFLFQNFSLMDTGNMYKYSFIWWETKHFFLEAIVQASYRYSKEWPSLLLRSPCCHEAWRFL